jgi:hypothetical protein
VQIALLCIGVMAQTVWFSPKLLPIGPTFYLVGLTLMLCGPMVGCFGLVLGYTSALMLRRLSLSFFFVPASLAAFALLFHRFGLMTVFNALAFALPMLLAFALGERIAYARRPVKTRQVGYVYGGTYVATQALSHAKNMIPDEEDVPNRNFDLDSTPPMSKPNGSPSAMAVRPTFLVQDRPRPVAKSTTLPTVTR